MSLDMFGHVDQVFESFVAERVTRTGGGYVDGIYQEGTGTRTPHSVNCQQATGREIETLEKGGERIVDGRVLHINDGIDASISPSDVWEFLGQTWKCYELDNRPWRNYCRAVVGRVDS